MVIVVGMARSGLAVARLLQANGIEVLATDTDPRPSSLAEFERASIPHRVGGHEGVPFGEAEEIVVSPGIPLGIAPLAAARSRHQRTVGELEVACRYIRGDIVAISGSNGKTTTTMLAAHLLHSGSRPVQVGGNIGTAASELVETSTSDTVNVLEVSSFQLDSIESFRPRVGALLNVTPDHLDRYADFEAYRRAKFGLFRNQEPDDFAVLNGDDSCQTHPPVTIRARKLFFGRSRAAGPDAWVESGRVVLRGREVLPIDEIPLRGFHNVENVLAAVLIAGVFEIGVESMASSIRVFQGVEHRLETVATIDGVEFVNDSKATNVASAVKAIESFDDGIILIAGGRDKGADFGGLVDAMEGRVRQVIVLGAASEKIERAVGQRLPVRHAGSMREAVDCALRFSRRGDVVLLAPACSSFDMYRNYEERGADFKRAVRSHAEVSA